MLEADPNLERNIMICQSIERCMPYCRLYNKKGSTVQTALDTFSLQRNRVFINS